MKLSEIFRRAARNLPQDSFCGMRLLIEREFDIWKQQIINIDFASHQSVKEHKKYCHLHAKAWEILYRFKPKRIPANSYWIAVKGQCEIYKNTIVVDSVKEAQEMRKNFLLICAEIAESEGL